MYYFEKHNTPEVAVNALLADPSAFTPFVLFRANYYAWYGPHTMPSDR